MGVGRRDTRLCGSQGLRWRSMSKSRSWEAILEGMVCCCGWLYAG